MKTKVGQQTRPNHAIKNNGAQRKGLGVGTIIVSAGSLLVFAEQAFAQLVITVPEPSSLALMGIGIVGGALTFARNKRRK